MAFGSVKVDQALCRSIMSASNAVRAPHSWQARNEELDMKRNGIGGEDCGVTGCCNVSVYLKALSSCGNPCVSAAVIAGCRSLGDKNYRHPEYMSRFFHSGELVASWSILLVDLQRMKSNC